MAKVYAQLDDGLIAFIQKQHVFFVATAPSLGGHVNLSPKGYDSLRVLSPTSVAYLGAEQKGEDALAEYRAQKNRASIDGLPGLGS